MPEYGLKFTKLTASGNDFVLFDDLDGEFGKRISDPSELARDICRRRLSVGADGLIILESSDKGDIRMRIINPDGSEAEMCGNGVRCCAYYAFTRGMGTELSVETKAGIIKAWVGSGGNIKIKMGDPSDIKLGIKLGIGESIVTVHSINTGVPHAVEIVEEIGNVRVEDLGRKIRYHNTFEPGGTNVDFVGKIRDGAFDMRTYERGVEAETLSCGTGTVASAIVLGLLEKMPSPVVIRTPSGELLKVHFRVFPANIVRDVYLEGPAVKVFEGVI